MGSVLRLFRFRPAERGFDAVIRDVVVPDIVRVPGCVAAFAGRIGPDELGERLVATVWTSQAAMEAGVGATFDRPVFHPELLAGSTHRRLDVLPLWFALPPERAADAAIVRLVMGTTRAGEHEAYLAAVRAGTTADRAAGVGPMALYLASQPPSAFATLSLWEDWSQLEASTGADIRTVARTRHVELLEGWSAEHYEAVPGIAAPTVRD